MKQSHKPKHKPIDSRVAEVASRHGNDSHAVLEVLRELQAEYGHLSADVVTDAARALKLPPRQAHGVATFYSMLTLSKRPKNIMRVCGGPVCWMNGGERLRHQADLLAKGDPSWSVEHTSCLGLCDRAPAVLVNDEQAGPLETGRVTDLTNDHRGQPTDYSQPRPGEIRVMLANAGLLDPDSLDSALAHDAYLGLRHALSLTPQETLVEVETSGLTGRGGAGFPVGRKWRFVAQAEKNQKFVICNADESEPLIFKDRVLIDTNPHQILEGMAIAGYACGASEAFIYIRGEYEYQARRLEKAIRQAEAAGWLGKDIQGSEFSFKVHVHRGAGAYICGEETALIESLEGKRGEPRLRPPYPPTAGYHNLPTLVNNVESYAAVPAILQQGAQWYRALSSYATPGTKLYMILGHVKKPGLFEAPFGLTLRQVVEDYGGGMLAGSTFQFALTGGAAGTIVPGGLMDIPIDYTSGSQGIALGAGAFLICDQSISPVAFLRELLHFFTYESCGKCTPCRAGTHQAHQILARLAAGEGRLGDVSELLELADNLADASFCGLGQSVATPLRSAINNFTAEFTAAEVPTVGHPA